MCLTLGARNMLEWTLGPAILRESRSFPGHYVRIGEEIRKSVVFLGVKDDTPGGPGIRCLGTGFLLGYGGDGYLVTAKHVILPLADAPYLIRMNTADGGSDNMELDEGDLTWWTHPDKDVDLAVAPFQRDLKKEGFDCLYIGSENPGWIANQPVADCGDFCYTIGLFQLLAGNKRNLAVVHSGNVALLPSDERIPVRDWDQTSEEGVKRVEGYLVQSESIQGLSGAPVFFRHVMTVQFPTPGGRKTALVTDHDLGLLGVWQGAWDASPDEVRATSLGHDVRVPVGMGVVVPASKLSEVLVMDAMKKDREARKRARAASSSSGVVKRPS